MFVFQDRLGESWQPRALAGRPTKRTEGETMSEREIVLDEPKLDEQSQALQNAVERAERAEAEVARLHTGKPAESHTSALQSSGEPEAKGAGEHLTQPGSANTGQAAQEKDPPTPAPAGHAAGEPQTTGVAALREDSMMAHLLDALDAGTDIGHYGRLVFSMVARHFLSDDEVITELTRDRDFSEEQARQMLTQVEGRDYSPPRRERILEWQAEQSFAIIPHSDDPDAGNVYKTLRFPKELYTHIGHYQEDKAESR